AVDDHRLIRHGRPDPVLWFGIGLALVMRILFWIFADPTFEDALITLTHAQNAAAGLGLTHHEGEAPVHGFTSVLSVMIPLAGGLIDPVLGLQLLRLVSLGAVVLAVLAAYRIGQRLQLGPWALLLIVGYLAVDRNQIFYGMAGMETQIAVAILLLSVWYVMT